MSNFITWFTQYNKLWIALLGAVLTTLSVQFPENQWVTILITFATAAGVFTLPNVKK